MTLSHASIDLKTISAINHYADQLVRQRRTPSASCLLPVRQAALDYLRIQGFPNMRAEPWRDSGLPSPMEIPFIPAAHDGLTSTDQKCAEKILKDSGLEDLCPARVVFINGMPCPALSHNTKNHWTLAAAQCELSSIRQSAADEERNGFTLLNTAFMPSAVIIRAASPHAPMLHIIHINLTTAKLNGAAAMLCPRIQISIDAGGAADVVESHLSDNFSGLVNAVTDIALERDSKLSYYALQPTTSSYHCLRSVRVRQKAHSRMRGAVISRGATDGACCDVRVSLAGDGASCEVSALHWLSDRRKQSLFLSIRHDASETRSRQLMLGLLQDQGSSHFRGRIYIPADVRGIDAGQKNDNLLLSTKARAVSLPLLEIYSDDVQCSHGVSVGYPHHDIIFYLRARGLALDEIERLLARGVVNRMEEHLPKELLRPLELSLLTDNPVPEAAHHGR